MNELVSYDSHNVKLSPLVREIVRWFLLCQRNWKGNFLHQSRLQSCWRGWSDCEL